MNDTTSRGDDDVLGGGFDQTNDMVGGLEGESGGTADGETVSEADSGGAGSLDVGTSPTVGGATHIGSDAPGDDRPAD
jgi:hypothetical protein